VQKRCSAPFIFVEILIKGTHIGAFMIFSTNIPDALHRPLSMVIRICNKNKKLNKNTKVAISAILAISKNRLHKLLWISAKDPLVGIAANHEHRHLKMNHLLT